MPYGASVFGGARAVLEIKPSSPFVVFYGTRSESQSAELTGKVVLRNAESMSVRSIKLALTGSRKIAWNTATTVTPQPITQKTRFLHETVQFLPSGRSHKLSAGVHEWDFKFTLPGTTDESVEGLATNWIVYDLHATVDRGYMSKHLAATSHIRVIRTLGRDVAESVPMEQINEDIWASKVAYKITVPQKNFIVGTAIRADFVLIPLRKGVEITTIKMELLESRQLFCDYSGRRIGNHSEQIVAQKEGVMPENSAHMVPDDVQEADQLFDESHRFTMTLDLPKSLKNCRQSVDTEHIRLTHKLRLYVNLLNPEGHTSQLLVKNSVNLFISPNLPPNEDQSVVVDPAIIDSAAVRDEVSQNAPPTYGRHQLDELYVDIDPSGFMTPGGQLSLGNSGANTPSFGHSRSGSYEDLASLNAMANGGGASAAALQNRLHTLSLNQSPRPSRYATNRHQSSGGSTPHGPLGYPDDAQPSPSGYFPDLYVAEYDMEALARTPSYNTALRSPACGLYSEDLPSYDVATSRPSSPTRISPSASSPDAVAQETERNTQINSRRGSPRRPPNAHGERRHRTLPIPHSSSPTLAASSALLSRTASLPRSTPNTTSPAMGNAGATESASPRSSRSIPAEQLAVPTVRTRSSSRSRRKPSATLHSEDARDAHHNPFRRILRNVH